MEEKERLDVRMLREGMAASREKAKELIRDGRVTVNGKTAQKAGMATEPADVIQVEERREQYVSRGGYKLARALDVFSVDPSGCCCLDAGASTGGFTDCLLQHGAARVYAVDVGTGQLHESLRKDARVIGREQVNVRYLDETVVPELCDLAVADVSYISLTKVLEALWSRVRSDGRVLCLVKPQFEAGPGVVDKKGVVRDAAVHRRVLERLVSYCSGQGWTVTGLTYSPIRGPEGNIEYLLCLEQTGEERTQPDIKQIVQEAHRMLPGRKPERKEGPTS